MSNIRALFEQLGFGNVVAMISGFSFSGHTVYTAYGNLQLVMKQKIRDSSMQSGDRGGSGTSTWGGEWENQGSPKGAGHRENFVGHGVLA